MAQGKSNITPNEASEQSEKQMVDTLTESLAAVADTIDLLLSYMQVLEQDALVFTMCLGHAKLLMAYLLQGHNVAAGN